jgi:hypothetical protein
MNKRVNITVVLLPIPKAPPLKPPKNAPVETKIKYLDWFI